VKLLNYVAILIERKNDMNPKISIIVPVYNVEKYINKCVDSILNQTFKGFELILIDDGSTDSSGKICDEYGELDERVIVIHKENGGVSSARNIGIDTCNGTYLAFVDPDDDIDENMYETLLQNSSNSDIDLIVCKIKTIDTLKNKTYESTIWNETNSIISKYAIRNQVIPGILSGSSYSIFSVCNKLYKTSVMKHHKMRFDEKMNHGEDARLNLILLEKINSILFLDIALYNYYKRDRQSLTTVFDKNRYDYILNNKKFGLSLCKKYNINDTDDYIDQYLNNTLNHMIDLVLSNVSIKEIIRILNRIMNDSEFKINILYYKCPSVYYKVLKRCCRCRNEKIFWLIVKGKTFIQNIKKTI